MKATLLIRKDHENMRELFDKFRRNNSRQNGRRPLLDEICRVISVHSSIESELFYPELQKSSSDRAQELVRSAMNDHRQIERLLSEAEKHSGNDKMYETHVEKLIAAVVHHIDSEEEILLEEARKTLAEPRLEELGLEMEVRRDMLNRIAA